MKQLFILVIFAVTLFSQKISNETDINKIDNIAYDKKRNQPITGLVKIYYENNKLKDEIPYKNNKVYGVWKQYDKNGHLLGESSYLDGKREGIEKFYSKDGTLIIQK